MTESHPEFLDRVEAIRRAAPQFETVGPLMREVINHATGTFIKTLREADRRGGENEDLAAYILYRQLIELTDAAEVLYSQSCVDASIPIVRAAFEASVSLDYVLQSPETSSQRSLCWVVGYVHGRIDAYNRLNAATESGQQLRSAFVSAFGIDLGDRTLPINPAAAAASLRTILDRPTLRPIEADYQRLRSGKRGRKPEWFSLMEGPKNRRELAAVVGRSAEYLAQYASWSEFSHAVDASHALRTGDAPGATAFLALRAPDNLVIHARTLVHFLLAATRKIVGHFRPGESLSAWYIRDVQRQLLELQPPSDP